MHYTLHLTTACNFKCDYCYSRPEESMEMDEQIILQSIQYAVKTSHNNCGLIFFGGEPLLKKDLIKLALEECQKQHELNRFIFHTKMVTNGMLLDEAFLKWANEVRMSIALSIDGIEQAHDIHRKSISNQATFTHTIETAKLLLQYQPYAHALMTITPETVMYYHDSVEFLIKTGFRYVIASINYAGNWTKDSLNILKKEYKKLAKLYEKLSVEGKKFYFSPFEVKLGTHIKGNKVLCVKCALAEEQISVSLDGKLYPCVQFVGDGKDGLDYCIGDVYHGLNEAKRRQLNIESQKVNPVCQECALENRCNNNCSCLNRQTTGCITEVSPVLCETERMIVPIVDKLGEKLYKKRVESFLQKHYNPAYPYFSYLEENGCML